MPKLPRHTVPIDDEFAYVVLSNQRKFNMEGYRLKQFSFPNPTKYPKVYSFTADVQKYINKVASTRLEVYKHAMRDIESVTTESITGTKYISLVESACKVFNNKIYSHENLMELCADVCTYTRCAYMKGLNPSHYWPALLMSEILTFMRLKKLFSDSTYSELDDWLLGKVRKIERSTGPMDLKPIELSLEWVDYPRPEPPSNNSLSPDSLSNVASCSSRPLDGNIDESITEKFETSRDTLREPETSEDKSMIPEIFDYMSVKPEIHNNILKQSGEFEDRTGNSEPFEEFPGSSESSESISPHSKTSGDIAGDSESSDGISGNSVISDDYVGNTETSESISGHSETSREYAANYETTEDDSGNSETYDDMAEKNENPEIVSDPQASVDYTETYDTTGHISQHSTIYANHTSNNETFKNISGNFEISEDIQGKSEIPEDIQGKSEIPEDIQGKSKIPEDIPQNTKTSECMTGDSEKSETAVFIPRNSEISKKIQGSLETSEDILSKPSTSERITAKAEISEHMLGKSKAFKDWTRKPEITEVIPKKRKRYL